MDPILTRDHRVNFGNAVHQAVAFALDRHRLGEPPTFDQVMEVFRQGWRVRPAEWDEQLESELLKEGQSERIQRVHETVRAYERDHTLLP